MVAPLMKWEPAAERLGITVRHLERLVFERRIPYVKLGDGRNAHVRFDPAQLDRWVADHTIPAAS